MNAWDRHITEALLERAVVSMLVRWQQRGHGWG